MQNHETINLRIELCRIVGFVKEIEVYKEPPSNQSTTPSTRLQSLCNADYYCETASKKRLTPARHLDQFKFDHISQCGIYLISGFKSTWDTHHYTGAEKHPADRIE
jgi:hypothetical protein